MMRDDIDELRYALLPWTLGPMHSGRAEELGGGR